MSDDCAICGKWPEKDRWALREMIDSLPLQEIERVCGTSASLASGMGLSNSRTARANIRAVRNHSFAFSRASFSVINARISSDMFRSFNHCSLYKVTGKRPIP